MRYSLQALPRKLLQGGVGAPRANVPQQGLELHIHRPVIVRVALLQQPMGGVVPAQLESTTCSCKKA